MNEEDEVIYMVTPVTEYLVELGPWRGRLGEFYLLLFPRDHFELWGHVVSDPFEGVASYTGPDVPGKFKSREEAFAHAELNGLSFVDSKGYIVPSRKAA